MWEGTPKDCESLLQRSAEYLLFVRKPPLAEQFITGQVELFQLFDVLEPGLATVPTVLFGFQSTCIWFLG